MTVPRPTVASFMIALLLTWTLGIVGTSQCRAEEPAAGPRALLGGEFKIGPDVALDSLAICAGNENYLLIWRDLRISAAPRMMALFVSATGVASSEFPISDAVGAPVTNPVQLTTLAFDGSNFMAVWADGRDGAGAIRGALITQSGTVVNNADFLIAPTSSATDAHPQVVATGTHFLVAWQSPIDITDSSKGQNIRYASVSSVGVPNAALTLPGSGTETTQQTLDFLVVGPTNEVLVIFQDASSSPTVTRGTRINRDDSIIAPTEGEFLFSRDLSGTGFGLAVGAAYEDQTYVILSSHGTFMDSTVFRTKLFLDGRVLRPTDSFAEVGQGDSELAENDYPRTYYNGSSKEFLFIRNDKVADLNFHMLMKRVTNEPFDRDPNLQFLDQATTGILNGGVAASIGAQYLVVWMDGRRRVADPPMQTNIYGTFVDGNTKGDEVRPYLRAVARAGPTIAVSPATIAFGTAGSTGLPDAIGWNFGDGATTDKGSVTHKYENGGDYVAVLTLVRAGFRVRDFARILIDGTTNGGAGGPAESTSGEPGPLSDGVTTDFFPTNSQIVLNFQKEKNDTIRIIGYLDAKDLPTTLKGKAVKVEIAGKTYEFTLDSLGQYFSDEGEVPIVRYALSRFSGAYLMTINLEDCRSYFAGLGATNETLLKPGKDIVVPLAMTVNGTAHDTSQVMNYTATAGKTGKLNYIIGSAGSPGDGFFFIFDGSVKETGKKDSTLAQDKAHTFVITGNVGFGNGKKLTKASSGFWRFTLGNFTQEIPVSSLETKGDDYGYFPPKGDIGVSTFIYRRKSGAYTLAFRNLPVTGNNASGMPLAITNVVRADLALSFSLDLENGETYQGSNFARFGRKDGASKTKKWFKR